MKLADNPALVMPRALQPAGKAPKLAAIFRDDLKDDVPIVGLKPLPDSRWEFLTTCCYTFDERGRERGLADVRLFPAADHLRILTEQWEAYRFLCVEKSSQILVTWWLAGCALYDVLKWPAQRIAWFCLKRPLAVDHLQSRVYRMYLMLPKTYAIPAAEFTQGEFRVYHDGTDKLPTSRITPMAAETDAADEAAKQMRSETWTRAIEDEAAFYRNEEELHFSLLPRTGALVKVSTPNGITFFNRLGYAADLNQPLIALRRPEMTEELGRGIVAWQRHGFRHVAVHYKAYPPKDPETAEGQRWWNEPAQVAARANSRKWRREMELDSSVPAGEPVFGDTERIVQEAVPYDSDLKVFRGWDFKYAHPVCVLIQFHRVEGMEAGSKRVRVGVFKELQALNMDIGKFYDTVVAPYMAQFLPQVSYQNQNLEDWGDPAGNAKEGTSGLSNIEVLRTVGVVVRSHAMRLETTRLDDESGRINVVQAVISNGDLWIDPERAPGVLAAFLGGYHRDDAGKIEKDAFFDDLADGCGYVIGNVLGLDYSKAVLGGQRVSGAVAFPAVRPAPEKVYSTNERVLTPTRGAGREREGGSRRDDERSNDRVWRPKRFEWKGTKERHR